MSVELGYQPVTKKRSSGLLFWSLIYLAIMAIPIILFFLAMDYWVPIFQEIFKDFKTTLPTPTTWLLEFSSWIRSPLIGIPLLLLFLGTPLLLGNFTSKIKVRAQRVTTTLIVTLVVMFISFSAFLLIETALFLPLVALIRSVSGGAPGE